MVQAEQDHIPGHFPGIFPAVACGIILSCGAAGCREDEAVRSGNCERIKGIFSFQRKEALPEVLAVFPNLSLRQGSGRPLFLDRLKDRYRRGDRNGFLCRLIIEALPPYMVLPCGPRLSGFFQEQGGRDDNHGQNYDDKEDRIIHAGYKLRDAGSLPYTLFSAVHQVVEMELLDHGLAVGADLIGHVVDVHGIKGVKIFFKAAGVTISFG